MSGTQVSHGRGGAGNINPDDSPYQDAEIVRAGEEGTGVSTGRGGAANILEQNAAGPRSDTELVPVAAIRPSTENQDHHVGRGGAGNEHHSPGHDHHKDRKSAPKGLADKLKAKMLGVFKK